MIKIALVQLSNKHTEIFGTFIEIFLKKKLDLTIYYNLEKDLYTFLKYYKKLFNCQLNIQPSEKLIENKDNHNFFIFTSSADDIRMPEIFKQPEYVNKCIFIQHQAAHWRPYMKWNILVSPVIKLEQNHSYIVPTYKFYKKLHCNIKQTNLAIIGAVRPHQKDKDLNILLDLLEKYPTENYKIYVFMRKMDWKVISNRNPFLKNNPHILFFPGLSTEKMIEKLKEVKFILPLSKQEGWFYWQRLTGTIPLAVNLNIPMIMDRKLADIYGIHSGCLLYQNKISEIMNKIMNISDDDYCKLIEGIVIYKREQYQKNKKAILELFSRMVKK